MTEVDLVDQVTEQHSLAENLKKWRSKLNLATRNRTKKHKQQKKIKRKEILDPIQSTINKSNILCFALLE